MATELTSEETAQVAAAIRREADRLDQMLRDYISARSGTRNLAVKSMAEEGAANVKERVASLRNLANKLAPPTTTKP